LPEDKFAMGKCPTHGILPVTVQRLADGTIGVCELCPGPVPFSWMTVDEARDAGWEITTNGRTVYRE
jgi:hypothetical protein